MTLARPLIPTLALASALAWPAAMAQDYAALRGTVAAALEGNPTVSAKLNAFQGASDGVDIARGALGPRVDLTGDVGVERSSFGSATATGEGTLARNGLGLRLTQVLWDGLGARHDTQRAGHERLSRYYELLDTTEQVALEAARALFDVERFRRLVALAEDNLASHRKAAEKIGSRVQAGVGRGVDLEQANARLALAESNLVTEQSNLHDVIARYRRLVGQPPPASAGGAPVILDRNLPDTAAATLRLGLVQSPAIKASAEAARAAQAAVSVQASALQPRVELRVRTGAGKNLNGVEDQRSDSAAEIVLNWNLWDGGSDRARVRQRAAGLRQALDLGQQACRDLRQTLTIAYHDSTRLSEQRALLERNTAAIERARDAYRQQFDIGQRSLLDLLNAENEAYTARRALANAETDRALAYARVHASLSQLGSQLGIVRPPAAEVPEGPSGFDDGAERCPLPDAGPGR